MIRATVYRYWRKPKASCNWCPRIEFAYGQDGILICMAENNRGEIFEKLRALGFKSEEILDPFGEVEVTPSQFKSIKL